MIVLCRLVLRLNDTRRTTTLCLVVRGNSLPSSPPLSPVGLDIASVEGSEADVVPSGGLLVAARDRMVGEPFLVGAPGTPSFTLPSSINLFTRQLNVSGIDWVEGLETFPQFF